MNSSMQMPELGLSRRLYAALTLVREGKRACDIGTDHALLPIALIKSGKCPHATASDIADCPCEIARNAVEASGEKEKITVIKTDGAKGLDGLGEDYIVSGMGGELIAKIIDDSPYLRDEKIHLVLQPMTKQKELRVYLAQNGFYIDYETRVFDMGKLYTVMSVFFDGKVRKMPEVSFEVGTRENIDKIVKEGNRDLIVNEIKSIIIETDKKIEGKSKGNLDTSSEINLKAELKAELERIEKI